MIQSSGLLQDRPCLCFNKDGSLLAVTTRDSGIKILANADGVKLVKMLEGGRVTQESKVTKYDAKLHIHWAYMENNG